MSLVRKKTLSKISIKIGKGIRVMHVNSRTDQQFLVVVIQFQFMCISINKNTLISSWLDRMEKIRITFLYFPYRWRTEKDQNSRSINCIWIIFGHVDRKESINYHISWVIYSNNIYLSNIWITKIIVCSLIHSNSSVYILETIARKKSQILVNNLGFLY